MVFLAAEPQVCQTQQGISNNFPPKTGVDPKIFHFTLAALHPASSDTVAVVTTKGESNKRDESKL